MLIQQAVLWFNFPKEQATTQDGGFNVVETATNLASVVINVV